MDCQYRAINQNIKRLRWSIVSAAVGRSQRRDRRAMARDIVTVMFGPPNKERSASGDGLQKKEAMYEAYTKLLPQLVPRDALIKLLVKWVPGFKKPEVVSTATIGDTGQSILKHPKSVLMEWSQKNSFTPPKTTYSEYSDSSRNMRIWTAKVVFAGKTVEAKASKKKDAEQKCFRELLKFVMEGRIKKF